MDAGTGEEVGQVCQQWHVDGGAGAIAGGAVCSGKIPPWLDGGRGQPWALCGKITWDWPWNWRWDWHSLGVRWARPRRVTSSVSDFHAGGMVLAVYSYLLFAELFNAVHAHPWARCSFADVPGSCELFCHVVPVRATSVTKMPSLVSRRSIVTVVVRGTWTKAQSH